MMPMVDLMQISNVLERLIDVGYQLNLGISLERSQELYFSCLHSQILPCVLPPLAMKRILISVVSC